MQGGGNAAAFRLLPVGVEQKIPIKRRYAAKPWIAERAFVDQVQMGINQHEIPPAPIFSKKKTVFK